MEILLFEGRWVLRPAKRVTGNESVKCSFKNSPVKAMFTLFEILLFEGRSVLLSAQRGTGSERVNTNNKLQFFDKGDKKRILNKKN